MRFQFPRTIMPPAMASRNRRGGFHAAFFDQGAAAIRPDAQHHAPFAGAAAMRSLENIMGWATGMTAAKRQRCWSNARPGLWVVDMWPRNYAQPPDVMTAEKWVTED